MCHKVRAPIPGHVSDPGHSCRFGLRVPGQNEKSRRHDVKTTKKEPFLDHDSIIISSFSQHRDFPFYIWLHKYARKRYNLVPSGYPLIYMASKGSL